MRLSAWDLKTDRVSHMWSLKGLFITSPWISEQSRAGGYQNQKSPFSIMDSLAGGARSFRNFPQLSAIIEMLADVWKNSLCALWGPSFLLSLQRLVESRAVYQVPSRYLALKLALSGETGREKWFAVQGAALSWSAEPFLEAQGTSLWLCQPSPLSSISLLS